MGWASQRGPRPRLVATSHRLASCVIVSGFRAALDLNMYPLRNLIRPWCAERAKPGRGKPVLIMHIGFYALNCALSRDTPLRSKYRLSPVVRAVLTYVYWFSVLAGSVSTDLD